MIKMIKSLNNISNQTLSSPLVSLAMTSLGDCLSTVHPMERQVPKTCFTVPVKFLAIDFSSMTLAIFLTCSKVRLPLWVTFFDFLSVSFVVA
jgi:hypothetical protein